MNVPSGEESDAPARALIPDSLTRIENALVRGCLEDLDRPHLVICRGVGAEMPNYVGPFPSAMAAVVAADQEEQMLRADGFDPIISVAVLLPTS